MVTFSAESIVMSVSREGRYGWQRVDIWVRIHQPFSDYSLSFSPRFANWNVIQLLTGYTVWFSQSEVVLHSNAAKYRKIWRIRQGTS